MLAACSTVSTRETIATLRDQSVQVREEKVEGGVDKAMSSYQRFLEETPDSELKPEALRRLADLKIEKEYGAIGEGAFTAAYVETDAQFERRTTRSQLSGSAEAVAGKPADGASDLENAGTREAIALYEELLDQYPHYERSDQVLYQMARAYEELGEIEKAMGVMDRMVRDYPRSRYVDQVQFRRAEHFFARKRYLDAEDAYSSIVDMGDGSTFYEFALYKLGWTFYKQELYEDALERFVALMDHKVSAGYDFTQNDDEQERKRTDDTFRAISLSFSYLGGADSAVKYFSRHGKRSYEDNVYRNLGEFYFDKRRFADAAAAYDAFVDRNPLHKAAPNFQMRVIEIQAAGGFPSLVLDFKKKFATTYGLTAKYWKHFSPDDRPDVLGYLATNLTDLANHYHASYQDPEQDEDKPAHFKEALHWYKEFLSSFPTDAESPAINFQLADLLLQNRSFGNAALEFERTAYGYPAHERSSQAGYAAVAAYRAQLGAAKPVDEDKVRRDVVRSSIMFADTFPEHEMAAVVLGAASDDLYGMKEFEQALTAAGRLIEMFPDADADVLRQAWVVVGHSSYELERYGEAESAYAHVLTLLPEEDETRPALTDNLAASIYKQGEQAHAAGDLRAAADHFLSVGTAAPGSTIRPAAEYDAAAALITLGDWGAAAAVLEGFRGDFPDNTLQPEVTRKLAYVYRENDQDSLAAEEFERVERESEDDEIRRDALLAAGDLYEKVGSTDRALEVYYRYVDHFPQPVELNLETRNKIAGMQKAQSNREAYLAELEMIVDIEASAGIAQTPRTRHIAAQAALVLARSEFDIFSAVRLVEPLEDNLRLKRERMKTAAGMFSRLVDYGIGEVTAAATFYLAEIYFHFSMALMESERPDGLSPLEMEQYDLAIEEEAYPFEEKAIEVHESNLMLISRGVFNEWVEKSLQRLAGSVPARYDKPEEASGIMSTLDTYVYATVRHAPAGSAVALTSEPGPGRSAPAEEPGSLPEPGTAGPDQGEEPDPQIEHETTWPAASSQAESPAGTERAVRR